MAIDMIEDSDLSAHSNTRLSGGKCFVNDDADYSNFSIVNKKKRTAQALTSITNQYDFAAMYKGGCKAMEDALARVQAEIEADLGKNYSKDLYARFVAPKKDIEAKIKTMIAESDCLVKKQEAERAYEQKQTIDVLASVANTPPPIIPEDTGATSSNVNKYIVYGVGGLILLIAVSMLLKKSN
jgi:hypothetical protein